MTEGHRAGAADPDLWKGQEGFPGPVRFKWRDDGHLAAGWRRWEEMGRRRKARDECARKAMACAKVQGSERAANTREPQVLRDCGEMRSARPHESGAMSKLCVIFLRGGVVVMGSQ